MKVLDIKVFKGKNIYSLKKCIRIDVDLEGYAESPSKDIEDFNFNILNILPELRTHRCGIDEDGGFVTRLKEGTYLSHICEHMIIAIQNKIGIDVGYGKAREIEGEKYYIIVQYIYENVALEVIRLSVDIINALIKKLPINYDERIKFIEELLREETIGPSTKAICDYASSIGLPVTNLSNSNFYQIGYGKQGRIIEASIGSNTKCVSVDISCDKYLTKEILKNQNIPIAKGFKVTNIIGLLKDAEYIGYPVVIKPQYGNQGKGVILNIQNEKELLKAYSDVKKNYKDIIIEKYHVGKDYRVCVINYEVVAVSLRLPPKISGDGKSKVKELIEILNINPLRGEDHEKNLTKVKLDEDLISYIKSQGYNLNSIPKDGEIIYLRQNANLSTGGEAVDCTELISNENIELCISTAKALKLDICGIDICIEDISKSIKCFGIIMEVNSAPGLRMHLYPSYGKSRLVGEKIVNMLYEGNPYNIPIISITGTNGKTTVSRVISHTLSKIGYNVGMTSTSGIYINEKCIHEGDDTGFDSAKTVLFNNEVDMAVLETARGGLIKKGLAYDLADVAIITNIREDHLGMDGINTMEELCHVKSLVGEAVKEDGYVVINADDYWSKNIINRIKSKIIFFSKDSNNSFITENKIKGIVVTIEEDDLISYNCGRRYEICSIKDIPITLEGRLEFNIENILGITATLIGLKIDYSMIKNGLKTFEINSNKNLGRFNQHKVNGINLILDYGHNADGYEAVLSSIKNISKGNVIGVIGMPGDRKDEYVKKIGDISSKYLDYIIIKEDKDLRGRKEGDIAKIIETGIKNKKNYEIILDEKKAFLRAIEKAKKDDFVVVFFEEINPLLEEINNIKELGFKKVVDNI
ncbi:cyanophycin synthetase [Clostridium sp.]|uniref:cyanophycin synthetase n=1 Tax=Clostridium sp. TaxID=1506 RepID=UPI002601D78A|nr:cyanophycin synthetase [Clostridium sp.]